MGDAQIPGHSVGIEQLTCGRTVGPPPSLVQSEVLPGRVPESKQLYEGNK